MYTFVLAAGTVLILSGWVIIICIVLIEVPNVREIA